MRDEASFHLPESMKLITYSPYVEESGRIKWTAVRTYFSDIGGEAVSKASKQAWHKLKEASIAAQDEDAAKAIVKALKKLGY